MSKYLHSKSKAQDPAPHLTYKDFTLELYKQFHNQPGLINPFKNIEVTHTPVQVLLFTDSPGWGNQHPLAAMSETTVDHHGIKRDRLTRTTGVNDVDKWKDGRYNRTNFNTSRAMGVYKLAHECREHGFTVQVIDNMFHLDIETTKRVIDKFVGKETLMLGVSSTFRSFQLLSQRPSISNFDPFEGFDQEEKDEWIADLTVTRRHFFSTGKKGDEVLGKYIHDINPNVKYIIGGANVTAQFENPDENGLMDYVNLGFGDVTFPQILQHLKDGGKADHLPTNKHNIMVTSDGESKLDIKHSTQVWQPEDLVQRGEILPLEVARGCIFKCSFCSFPLNGKGKGEAVRDFSYIREELIDNYEKYGIEDYWLTDDTFNDDHQKMIDWHAMVKTLPFKLKWSSYIRLDLVYMNRKHNPPQAQLIAESGCRLTNLGIETTDPECAKDIGKGLNPDIQFAYLRELADGYWKGMTFMSGMIAGLPSDTRKTLNKMSKFLLSKENPLHTINMNPLYIRKTDDDSHYFTELSISEFSANWKEHGYVFTEFDKNGEEIPVDARGTLMKSNVSWKNRNGLTFYDIVKYAMKFNTRLAIANKHVSSPLFVAHGLPYHDERLAAPGELYDEQNNFYFNYKEYCKVNDYFYKLFTENHTHYYRK